MIPTYASLLQFTRDVALKLNVDSVSGAQIGIVQFSSDADVVTELTGDVSSVLSAIAGVSQPIGYTSVSDGLALGRTVVNGTNARNGLPRAILLLTDGEQTVDGGDDAAIAEAEAASLALSLSRTYQS